MAELTTLQKALLAIKKLKQQEAERKQQMSQPIAIIGMSCRFSEANTLEEFWNLLLQGKSVISQYPEQRWELLKNTAEILLRKNSHPYWGSFLENISGFDAYFFGITPREALRMDPQQRVLLELAYEAFEDAGISVEALAGSNTGVFASLYGSQYAHLQQLDSDMDALYLPTGNAASIAANRLSYFFDLRGPSMVLDTACSSSLVAIHNAVINLRQNLCDQAIVCGVNINLLPSINYVLAQAKMLSPEGKCKTFSADADGYVQGEGGGAIILKPLTKALQDKDRIYAVITGSAINQDGKTNGLTAPNGLQQEKLLREAYTIANTDPKEIAYVECHGTGTFLGDPIELQALGNVIGKDRTNQNYCWIGSVKTNLGHLEPAAGIASIIKVALSLQHNKIPAHLHFTTPNPNIDFDKYHLRVPQKTEDYPSNISFSHAGVSGFGFGGTNCHIVLRNENAQQESNIVESNKAEIFTLSAKNMEALKQYIYKWINYLFEHPQVNLRQLCYNLHVRRSHYTYRLAIITHSISELLTSLRQIEMTPDVLPSNVFLYSGNAKHSSLTINSDDNNSANLASAYVSGANIDWKKIESEQHYQYMNMPLYPWQHKTYWPTLKVQQHVQDSLSLNDYPLRGKQISSPLKTLQFEFKLDNKAIPDMPDTFNVLHAGYYMEMLAFIVSKLNTSANFGIQDHYFLSPIFVLNDMVVAVTIALEMLANETYSYAIYSRNEDNSNWVQHAKGYLILNPQQDITIDTINVMQIRERLPTNELAEQLYEQVLAMGMPAGDSIRWTHQYWRNETEILSEFRQPNTTANKNSLFALQLHPGIIDAAIQPLFKLLPSDLCKPYIASHVNSVKFFGMQSGPYFLYGTLNKDDIGQAEMTGNCYLLNHENKLIASFQGITLTQLDNKFSMESIIQAKPALSQKDLAMLSDNERKSYIINFLIEQVAIMFSMPAVDIDIHTSLHDMGIDSLMALVLMRTLEAGLGVTYSLPELLKGPSIHQLTEYILKHNNSVDDAAVINASYTKTNTPWIAYREPRTQPKIRLFCFPYGGGGASIYRHWQREIPDSIEICPIQIPGREGRMNETPINNITLLIDSLIDNLQHEFAQPFAFFGHSFGALIAFELSRELRKRHLPQPIHLFVSAFPDPRVPNKSLNALLKQLHAAQIDLFAADTDIVIEQLNAEKLAVLSDILNANGINDYGDNLKNKEISKALLPIFCGDMGIVKSYEFYDAEPLDFAITVFAGKRDTWVAFDDHLQWGDHTKHKFAVHAFDSGHMFIKEDDIRGKILQQIQFALGV